MTNGPATMARIRRMRNFLFIDDGELEPSRGKDDERLAETMSIERPYPPARRIVPSGSFATEFARHNVTAYTQDQMDQLIKQYSSQYEPCAQRDAVSNNESYADSVFVSSNVAVADEPLTTHSAEPDTPIYYFPVLCAIEYPAYDNGPRSAPLLVPHPSDIDKLPRLWNSPLATSVGANIGASAVSLEFPKTSDSEQPRQKKRSVEEKMKDLDKFFDLNDDDDAVAFTDNAIDAVGKAGMTLDNGSTGTVVRMDVYAEKSFDMVEGHAQGADAVESLPVHGPAMTIAGQWPHFHPHSTSQTRTQTPTQNRPVPRPAMLTVPGKLCQPSGQQQQVTQPLQPQYSTMGDSKIPYANAHYAAQQWSQNHPIPEIRYHAQLYKTTIEHMPTEIGAPATTTTTTTVSPSRPALEITPGTASRMASQRYMTPETYQHATERRKNNQAASVPAVAHEASLQSLLGGSDFDPNDYIFTQETTPGDNDEKKQERGGKGRMDWTKMFRR
jgi:hypothetical protein